MSVMLWLVWNKRPMGAEMPALQIIQYAKAKVDN
jgi:hypothetical protein